MELKIEGNVKISDVHVNGKVPLRGLEISVPVVYKFEVFVDYSKDYDHRKGPIRTPKGRIPVIWCSASFSVARRDLGVRVVRKPATYGSKRDLK
jgi:hypothetical protein